jgi:hypothetical protein
MVTLVDGETSNQVAQRTEAEALRGIGSHLRAGGIPTVEMRLPVALCERAMAAWERDDEQDDCIERETREQSVVRHQAAILALIGLALHEMGAVAGTSSSLWSAPISWVRRSRRRKTKADRPRRLRTLR